MPMDHELRLINRAWKGDGSGWKDLVAAKLTPDMFFNDDAREVFKYALQVQQRHGSFPSQAQIKGRFPNLRHVAITDPLSLLIDDFKEWRRAQVLGEGLREAAELYADGRYDDSLVKVENFQARIAAESITDAGDVDLTENPLDRYKAYEAFASRPAGLLGYTTGFPTLDNITCGLQKKQLVVVVAEPKVGKSTLAVKMGIAANDAGANVMLQTIEMSADEMTKRYDAMRAGVSFNRLRTGTLKAAEKMEYRKMLAKTALPNKFVVTESVINLAQIAAKIEETKPDIVIVDGVYLLQTPPEFPPLSSQALTFLSRSFKQLAKTTDTVIILTTQALHQKLQGGKLSPHSIGYTSSFLQDADIVIGLQENDSKDEDMRILSILASRSTGLIDTNLDWDWDTGTFEEMGSAAA